MFELSEKHDGKTRKMREEIEMMKNLAALRRYF
jgi:hypothetical protein